MRRELVGADQHPASGDNSGENCGGDPDEPRHDPGFAISKVAWIKRQQKKFQEQEREPPREFVERESHYVWGKRYLLKIEETDVTPRVELRHHRLALHIRPDTDVAARQALFDAFYRRQIRAKVGSMIAKWEPILQVKVNRVLVQRMKTK